jgi:hypothetical protein
MMCNDLASYLGAFFPGCCLAVTDNGTRRDFWTLAALDRFRYFRLRTLFSDIDKQCFKVLNLLPRSKSILL